MLSLKQIQNVCQGNPSNPSGSCRYLERDDLDPTKHYCLKLIQDKKSIIDKRVNDFLKDCKNKGKNPHDQNVPLGDNCSGYIKLKSLSQGYDVK